MRLSEETKLSIRLMKKRPLETIMLVLGIALGIGATAAGAALYQKAVKDGKDLLNQVEYREILVSAREESAEMNTPAVKVASENSIILTAADLEAAEISESVAFAYLATETRHRFAGFSGGAGNGGPGGQPGMAPPQPPAADDARGGGQSPPGQQEENIAAVSVPAIDEAMGLEVTPQYFEANSLNAALGGMITEADMNSRVMVLGSEIGRTLFEGGPEEGIDDDSPLNRQIVSRREIYTIIGVLEPTGTAVDYQILTPAANTDLSAMGGAMRKFAGLNSTLHFTVADAADLEHAAGQLSTWFNQEVGEGNYNISIPRDEAEAAAERSEKIALMILLLALSALLIAAVNVANILYGRAVRRKKHVGIMKALGSSRVGIFLFFIKEAVMICLGGAVLGTLIALFMSASIRNTAGDTPVESVMIIAGILGACLLTFGFTLFPALQASKIAAVEAIRNE